MIYTPVNVAIEYWLDFLWVKRHSQNLWSIELRDDKGTRYMPVYGGIVTAKTKAEAEKVLSQWREVRCMPTPEAKVVRVKVQTVR